MPITINSTIQVLVTIIDYHGCSIFVEQQVKIINTIFYNSANHFECIGDISPVFLFYEYNSISMIYFKSLVDLNINSIISLLYF